MRVKLGRNVRLSEVLAIVEHETTPGKVAARTGLSVAEVEAAAEAALPLVFNSALARAAVEFSTRDPRERRRRLAALRQTIEVHRATIRARCSRSERPRPVRHSTPRRRASHRSPRRTAQARASDATGGDGGPEPPPPDRPVLGPFWATREAA